MRRDERDKIEFPWPMLAAAWLIILTFGPALVLFCLWFVWEIATGFAILRHGP
jgi:hypothetical protein